MKSHFKVLLSIFILGFLTIKISAKVNAHKHYHHQINFDEKDTIKAVITKFLTALHDNNFEEAKKYTLKDHDAFFEMMEHFSKDPNAKKGPIPTIKEINIDGNKATVTLSATPPMKLEKENGVWKVDVRMKPLPK